MLFFGQVAGDGGGGAQLSGREEMEIGLIRSLIVSYFAIVREIIEDLVPEAIIHLLVNHSAQQVQNRLVSALYKPALFDEFLNEDVALVAVRACAKALLDAYRDAFKTRLHVLFDFVVVTPLNNTHIYVKTHTLVTLGTSPLDHTTPRA